MGLFLNVFGAIATFTTRLYARRRRTWIMAGLIALPALLPPLAAYYRPEIAEDGVEVFDAVVQFMFLLTLTPLTALVYGCSLLSDEIEGRTLPLLLSRAAPRSAIVLGKFASFSAVSIALLLASLALTFGSFAFFLKVPLAENLSLVASYAVLIAIALVAYGALCVAVSTLTRRPVVVSALFIFGWEKLVVALPGYADFLTLQKYILRLLPEVTFNRVEIEKVELPPELMRAVYPVSASLSVFALAVSAVVFLCIACLVVRSREYVTAGDTG